MNPYLAGLAIRHRKVLLAVVGLVALCAIGLVLLVSSVAAVIPLTPDDVLEQYKKVLAAAPVKDLPLEGIVAVDAVRHHQDWAQSTPASIEETAKLFYKCAGGSCSRRSLLDVMADLKLTDAEQEQVHQMVAAQLGTVDGGGDCSGFVPNPAAPYVWPVQGRITACFGMRDNPTEPGTEEFHTGVDIAADEGTPVLAAAAGKVTFVGWSGGYGNLVVVQTEAGDMETWYGHLSAFAVRVGQTVKAGEVVGMVGSTGRSTGPHLHFEVRNHTGSPADPTDAFM